MLGKAVTALAFCTLLGACDSSKKSFEDSFNQNFHAKLIASCTKSATDAGVAPDLSIRMCTCASDKVRQRYTVREKMTLQAEQLKPIIEECKVSIPA